MKNQKIKFFEKVNEIYKCLARLIKTNEHLQSSYQKQKGGITTDLTISKDNIKI